MSNPPRVPRPRTSAPIPASIAPVFIVRPRKPPITSTNNATLIAPYSVPLLYALTEPSAPWMPYVPEMGASNEPLSSFCGFCGTV